MMGQPYQTPESLCQKPQGDFPSGSRSPSSVTQEQLWSRLTAGASISSAASFLCLIPALGIYEYVQPIL